MSIDPDFMADGMEHSPSPKIRRFDIVVGVRIKAFVYDLPLWIFMQERSEELDFFLECGFAVDVFVQDVLVAAAQQRNQLERGSELDRRTMQRTELRCTGGKRAGIRNAYLSIRIKLISRS